MALDLSELLSAGNTQKKPFYPSFASALEPFSLGIAARASDKVRATGRFGASSALLFAAF